LIVKRKRQDKVQVTFVLDEPPTEPVFVAGDFNDWSRDTAFKKAKDGSLRATVTLPPGERVGFRYVTKSGSWFDEPEADAYEPNDQGGTNCIVLP
jgi:1,4-alpha-glucan branching enzyme